VGALRARLGAMFRDWAVSLDPSLLPESVPAEEPPLLPVSSIIPTAAEASTRDPGPDLGRIAESAEKLHRRLYLYFAALLKGGGDFPAIECNAPWVSSVVEADGTVRPCFFQPPLGNLRDGRSFTEILNGPAAVAWRRGLDMERDAICRRCVCSLSLRETS